MSQTRLPTKLEPLRPSRTGPPLSTAIRLLTVAIVVVRVRAAQFSAPAALLGYWIRDRVCDCSAAFGMPGPGVVSSDYESAAEWLRARMRWDDWMDGHTSALFSPKRATSAMGYAAAVHSWSTS